MTSGPQTNQPKKHLTNFKSVTKETRFIRGLKTLAPVTDWEGSLPLVFNHCRDASLDYTPTFQGCQTTQGCLPWSFTTSGRNVRPLSPSQAIASPVTSTYMPRWPEVTEESQKK
ncbi:embryonic stem cell-related gene protein-like isoform X3 [Pan troglodytes]|uniref:embryonic stem cell-related gene protein-like isoform X3 n=1 Tax=Pan troglodytes TaxID=9598 RepID=UPI0023F522B6|nr:embryonic stem cell-related gene protein-like isoform X2 [Pan troglodytes]